MNWVRFLLGRLAMFLLNVVTFIVFLFVLGTFKFTAVPVCLAGLFVLYYFTVQSEEASKKVVSE